MTRTDEEENTKALRTTLFFSYGASSNSWDKLSLSAVCPLEPQPVHLEEGKVPYRAWHCQCHLVVCYFIAGTWLQPFWFQTLHVFPASLSASLEIQNCWVWGASPGERRQSFHGSVLAEPYCWLSETAPPSVTWEGVCQVYMSWSLAFENQEEPLHLWLYPWVDFRQGWKWVVWWCMQWQMGGSCLHPVQLSSWLGEWTDLSLTTAYHSSALGGPPDHLTSDGDCICHLIGWLWG